MGLVIEGDAFVGGNESRWRIEQDGGYVGHASAAGYSPRVKSNIAVAMVATSAIESGRNVEVLSDDGRRLAKIVSFPIA